MPARYAIFCVDPLDSRSAEPDFRIEVDAAREAGFTPVLLDHDALDQRINPDAALRKTRIAEPGHAIYRGWMLRSEAYRALYDSLTSRGVELCTNPASYDACHHAPNAYPALSNFMPHTTWVTQDKLNDPHAITAALAQFDHAAVVIKDWVKSQAGYWSEACYIPNAADKDHANSVIERFLELQGDSLVGGVMFKAYVPLIPRGHPADEYRAFVVDGALVGCWPRSSAAAKHTPPPSELIAEIASKTPSPFASADFGVDDQGKWWLLETGDGQVSGLPTDAAAKPLFEALAALGLRTH